MIKVKSEINYKSYINLTPLSACLNEKRKGLCGQRAVVPLNIDSEHLRPLKEGNGQGILEKSIPGSRLVLLYYRNCGPQFSYHSLEFPFLLLIHLSDVLAGLPFYTPLRHWTKLWIHLVPSLEKNVTVLLCERCVFKLLK